MVCRSPVKGKEVLMSVLNPGLYRSQPRSQAASLKTTLTWYARHGWSVLEAAGRRRAAGELRRLANRLNREGHLTADDLEQAAQDLTRR
jgi:hypothetical protein